MLFKLRYLVILTINSIFLITRAMVVLNHVYYFDKIYTVCTRKDMN